MKKYSIYFLIFIFFIGLFDIEKYISFVTDTISFFVIFIYCFISLFTKDVEVKNIYKEDKEWIWFFILAMIFDLYKFLLIN